jgi:hypothetical protein
MTVQEAIEWLQKLPDKQIVMLVDCPYCGRGNQLSRIDEAVVLHSETESEEGTRRK